MEKELIAHVRRDRSTGEVIATQSLKEHSGNVAVFCSENCRVANLSKAGKVAGLQHDGGKSSVPGQTHLEEGTRERVNHSSAGMRYIWEHCEKGDRLTGQLISLAIGCHHSGRNDYMSLDGRQPWLEQMYSKQANSLYPESIAAFFPECCSEEEVEKLLREASEELSCIEERAELILPEEVGTKQRTDAKLFGLGMVQRFLLSALRDADCVDTACFMNGIPLPTPPSDEQRQANWDLLAERMERFVKSLKAERPIDLLRQEISDQCLQAGQTLPAGVYRLCVPTGGGKTYSALRFGLQMAKRLNVQRLFYFAPYKSVVHQNANHIREALGEEHVLEHHSDVLFEQDEKGKQEKWLACSERWKGKPVICTTVVQLLNALFAAPLQDVRRFSALAGSVLLLDEVQALPLQHTCLLNLALNTLARLFDCTIVLCTATQPALAQVEYPLIFSPQADLVPDYQRFFRELKRTRIIPPAVKGGMTIPEIANFLMDLQKENRSILVILNTKKMVNKLYDALKPLVPQETALYCVTTRLCSRHREDVLKQITERLNAGLPLICVSTQLFEAGVDLSFSSVVRAIAGLPSIVQAAGRDNRNAEGACSPLYLIECRGEDLCGLPEIQKGRRITRELLAGLKEGEDLLSPEMIQEYYKRYYDLTINKLEMKYPISGKGNISTTMVDLLTSNRQGLSAFLGSGKVMENQKDLCQAFGTAEKAFAAIPDETVPVLVPYGKGEEKLLALQSGLADAALLRELQAYTVSISQSEYKQLRNVLHTVLDGAALVLPKKYYDANKGLSLEPVCQD